VCILTMCWFQARGNLFPLKTAPCGPPHDRCNKRIHSLEPGLSLSPSSKRSSLSAQRGLQFCCSITKMGFTRDRDMKQPDGIQVQTLAALRTQNQVPCSSWHELQRAPALSLESSAIASLLSELRQCETSALGFSFVAVRFAGRHLGHSP
jgi:hypothetical protein